MRSFGSDNHCGVHPQLLQSLLEANQDHAPSYGTDVYSERLQTFFTDHIHSDVQVFAVFNGTGANVLALRILAATPATVICSDVAHIHVDECGAPEQIAGVKLWPISCPQGKLEPSLLDGILIRSGDQHFSQFKVLSITQPTEYGTCYSLSELKALSTWARKHHLQIHIDGARIANALQFLNLDWREFFNQVDFDVLSLGGTKNGLMMGELLVIKNGSADKKLSAQVPYLRKQCLQLPSKTRFISAQFLTYFESDLWRTIARHSHHMALKLAEEIQKNSKQCEITKPVESNAVFVKIPKTFTKTLKNTRFFYVWDERTWECRLMTHWDTNEEDIKQLIDQLKVLEGVL